MLNSISLGRIPSAVLWDAVSALLPVAAVFAGIMRMQIKTVRAFYLRLFNGLDYHVM